jgi:putative addiction module CopG family antidote
MPSKYALNVSLTEHLCEFVAAQVASGRFGTSSEVVRAALRLLERDLVAPASFAQQDGVNVGPAVLSGTSGQKSNRLAE